MTKQRFRRTIDVLKSDALSTAGAARVELLLGGRPLSIWSAKCPSCGGENKLRIVDEGDGYLSFCCVDGCDAEAVLSEVDAALRVFGVEISDRASGPSRDGLESEE